MNVNCPLSLCVSLQPVGLSSSASASEDAAASMADEVALTVKYLSSPKLLRLQLQDAALRRHFLVQARAPSLCFLSSS